MRAGHLFALSVFAMFAALPIHAAEPSTPNDSGFQLSRTEVNVPWSSQAFTLDAAATTAVSANEDIWTKFDDKLHLAMTFSLWATSANGTFGVRDQNADIDACFSDLIKHASYAFNPSIELWKGKWEFIFAMTLSKLHDNGKSPLGTDVDVASTIGAFDFLVGYSVIQTRFENDMTLVVTPVIGAQVTYVDAEIDPEFLQKRTSSTTFVDPIIGCRTVWGFAPRLDLRAEGTIGGFGIGSNLTWSAGMYLDWEFVNSFSLGVGYRALAWDYDLGPGDTDLILHGPWIGLTWRPF